MQGGVVPVLSPALEWPWQAALEWERALDLYFSMQRSKLVPDTTSYNLCLGVLGDMEVGGFDYLRSRRLCQAKTETDSTVFVGP